MLKKGKPFSVDTSPTKEIVVTGLTRDISVEACIFDLIDNSIDAAGDKLAVGDRGSTLADSPLPYERFSIALFLDGNGCSIEDNCGGIPIKDLKEMVLRFGKRSAHNAGIGVFGIGLNRALFKLGRVSHLRTDTGRQRAELILNTEEYLKSDDWNLPAEEFRTSGKAGTVIEIRQLPEEIARFFADAETIETFRCDIGRRYGSFIRNGLRLALNGTPVAGEEIRIRGDGPYEGGEKSYTTEEGVHIDIEFGQHEDHRFSAEPDYDKPRNTSLTDRFGWTVMCNDRAIVVSDKSWKTGWDTKFHTEFYGFVGFVSFRADDSSKLPWDTTKTKVDLNNRAYQAALGDMRHFAEKWRSLAVDAKNVRRRKEVLLPTPGKNTGNQTHSGSSTPSLAVVDRKRNATPTIKKPLSKEDHNQYRTVLPQDLDERNCFDKHLALVHEAKRLDISVFTYSGLALIRTLLETTIATYCERHGIYAELKRFAMERRRKNGKAVEDEKKVMPDSEEMLAFLENNPEIWGAAKLNPLRHNLRKLGEHKKMLNSVVHNAWQPIHRTQAYDIRDNAIPLIRHLIET